jgi:serine/threonine protein phosphatase PrpC
MIINIVTATAIGPAHIDQMLANQDSVYCKSFNGYWAVAVADGMGSRISSHIGSKLAVNIAVDACLISPFNISEREIITKIYSSWLSKLEVINLSPNDAVTTLLFAWGKSNGEYRYFQLGDGEIVSNVQKHTANKTDNFSNETTGLGLSKKLSDWCIGTSILSEHEKGLTLMTDGISEDIDDHIGFCESIIDYAKNKSRRSVKNKLTKLIESWPTPYHTDDKTIAVVTIK